MNGTIDGYQEGAGKAQDDGEIRLWEGHERLTFDRKDVDRVVARVRLKTHAEEVPVSEELRIEHADIERFAVDRIVSEPPLTRVEDGVTIIPVVEEVLVKRFRIVEEIRITHHVETISHDETVSLRRQDVVIDEAPDGLPAAGRLDPGRD